MAASTPRRVPTTPPSPALPAAPPKGRTRKPSAKVLEAQQSLRTRSTASRSTHNGPSASATVAPEREGRDTNLDEIASLITNLKETITQQTNIITNQNSTIESIRTDLAAIKAEQQNLKSQNAELQETMESLRTQLDTLSIEPPSTQTWATVAASGRPVGSGMSPSRSTNSGIADKENSRQLVIDVSKVREEVAETVATTEAAKQAIQQGMNNVERLAGATVKGFRVWRANDSASVIKFSVDKDKEAAFRQTTTEWLEPQIPGARLVGPKWYPVKADWVEVSLAMDAESGKVSRSAMERFGMENKVEVCTMRWLGRPRPSGQHASVVIKVATKEEAEKLLRSDRVTFGGGGSSCRRSKSDARLWLASNADGLVTERETACDQRRAICADKRVTCSARRPTCAV